MNFVNKDIYHSEDKQEQIGKAYIEMIRAGIYTKTIFKRLPIAKMNKSLRSIQSHLNEVMKLFGRIGNIDKLNLTVSRNGQQTPLNYNIE